MGCTSFASEASRINSLLSQQDNSLAWIGVCGNNTWSETKLFDIIEETGRKWTWISGVSATDNKKMLHPLLLDQVHALNTMDPMQRMISFLLSCVSFCEFMDFSCLWKKSLDLFVIVRKGHSEVKICVCVSVKERWFYLFILESGLW